MKGTLSAGVTVLVLALGIWLLATVSAGGDTPYVNDPPDCATVSATPGTIKPGGFTLVTLSGATDPEGDALTYTVDDVFQDEPVGPTIDARVGTSSGNVFLRWERDGTGTGRFYTIAFTVSDGDLSCTGTATVAVPRKKGAPLVDEGPLFDSFTGAPA